MIDVNSGIKGPRPINVIQINLHHSKLAMSLLDKALSNMSEAVVLAQEPYAPNGQVRGLANSVQVLCVVGKQPVCAAIFVKNVNLVLVPSLTD